MSHKPAIPSRYGVSFSAKQCRNFGNNPTEVLDWLLKQGWQRFRLMSYWDDCERNKDIYQFAELDKQLQQIARVGGEVTLCLGVRQPRWPENHWPDWAWALPKPERDERLQKFITTVVERYRDNPQIVSYQLENEALLTDFGERSDTDRSRLVREYQLVKQLDPGRPIIITTSTSWGIPLRQPIPDIVGFSFYQVLFSPHKGRYTTSFHKPWLDRLRARAIRLIHRRPSFIHELQLEPWGPANIWEMSVEEQDKSMSPEQIARNLSLAHATHLAPIDLWGGEWWYHRAVIDRDPAIWQAVRANLGDM